MDDQSSAFLPSQGWTAIAARLPFILLLLSILFALTTYYTHRTLVTERHQALVSERASEQADRLANTVDEAVAKWQAEVEAATSRFEAQALPEGVDEQDHNATYEAELAASLPDADRVLVLTPADPRLEADRDFVAQLQAVQLFSGDETAPEILRDGHNWQVAIPSLLGRNDSDTPAAAIVFLATSRLALPEAENLGEISLSQSIPGGGTQNFHRSGQGDSAFRVTRELDTPHWQLSFAPGPALTRKSGLWTGQLLAGFAALLALLCLIGAIALKVRTILLAQEQARQRQQRQQDADLQRYHDALSLLDQYHEGDDLEANSLSQETIEPVNHDAEREDRTPVLFREYDIRGDADELLSDALVADIGHAIGSEVLACGDRWVVLARDGRLSSPRLAEALTEGLLATGCNVVDVGLVPTPVMNFAALTMDQSRSGIMITASHNPSGDNGFKIVIAGEALSGERIQDLYRRIQTRDFVEGQGLLSHRDVRDDYFERIMADMEPSRLRVVLDAANGAAGPMATELLARLGCDVIPLYCEPDGNFPHHPPDPTREEHLSDLRLTVKSQGADLGVALDGDGDRMVAMTADGTVVWPDELMMIFSRDVLARQPGANIVFDVKCTHRLPALIEAYGGIPMMRRTGHSHIRAAVAAENAPLGGEYSGHLFFPDRWFGFDDGLYAAARLIEVISLREQPLGDIVATLPTSVASAEILLPTAEADKFRLIEQLQSADFFPDADTNSTDGLRVQWSYGWGLVRASNTSAQLTLRFEADSEEHLEAIRQRFRKVLAALEPAPDINF